MTAANLDVRPAIAPDIVEPSAANLILLFALAPMPVSAQPLVCYWHRDAVGRLVCAWEPDISPEDMWRDSLLRKTVGKDRGGWLSHAAPPTLDRVLHNRAIDLVRPSTREACGGALWPALVGRRCKTYAHRHRYALTDRDRLPVA